METRALTVEQISVYFKQIFDAEELLYNVRVVGEISGLSITRGVAYFTLKDEKAQMSCVCFNPDDFVLKNGDKVIATGTPRYYVKGGKLNFNTVKIEQYGLGELYQKFLELKEKLSNLGYFDESIKKPMPSKIEKIGVVTSPTGAVIQDIINIRNRRNKGVSIVLYPSKVQGVGAEKEIAHGIEVLDCRPDVDVIVVARGGGSLEDLMPFNTETVANAIFKANKPIVSAVGHETDFTICDFCSDLRVPTPSAASELLCQKTSDNVEKIKSMLMVLRRAVSSIVETNSIRLKNSIISLSSASKNYINDKTYELSLIDGRLKKLDPKEILKLGYSVIKGKSKYISSIKNVSVGEEVDVILKDGKAVCKVIDKREEELWIMSNL